MTPEPITEEWLREVGFKWHQFDRQPTKHWLLWLADTFPRRMFHDNEDFGIELAALGEIHRDVDVVVLVVDLRLDAGEPGPDREPGEERHEHEPE